MRPRLKRLPNLPHRVALDLDQPARPARPERPPRRPHRVAWTAAATPPAAATWLSLIKAASPSPIRWLRRPRTAPRTSRAPAARASSSWCPAPPPRSPDRVRPGPRRGRDPRQVGEEVEHRPLRSEHRRGAARSPAAPRPPPAAAPRPRTSAAPAAAASCRRRRGPVQVPADQVEHRERDRHPGQHPGLARDHVRGHRPPRHRRRRRHVGPVREVLVERRPHRPRDVVGVEPGRPQRRQRLAPQPGRAVPGPATSS